MIVRMPVTRARPTHVPAQRLNVSSQPRRRTRAKLLPMLRIVVWDSPRHQQTPTRPGLRSLVTVAAERADLGPFDVCSPDMDGLDGGTVGAVVWDAEADRSPRWPQVPTLFVELVAGAIERRGGLGPLRPISSGGRVPEDLRISCLDVELGIENIATWLRANLSSFSAMTVEERRMLEVVLDAVRRALEEGVPGFDEEEAAQVLAAADTGTVQLRTPRPSRQVLRWVVEQLYGFPVGVLSGMAANCLPQLIHHFTL